MNLKHTLRSLFIFSCFLGLVSTDLSSQIIGIDLLDQGEKTEIPFEMEQGFIIVQLWLNGIIPVRMIFDTGAENTILFDKEVAQILGIKFDREISIVGSDLDSVLQAYISRNVSTTLNGCQSVKRDLIILQDNNLFLKERLGTEINGILGGSYFPNLVVSIDYKKQIITLEHPSTFDPPTRKYEAYDINIISNKPYLPVTVSITGEIASILNLLVDTGASLPFLVHANTDTSLHIPDQVMVGSVGYGLSGAVLGYRGKTRQLSMGKLYFNEIVTSFQDLDMQGLNDIEVIRNGILGNTLLSRFTVIIDYTKSKLYLKPNRKYNKGFDFDKSGMTLLAIGSDLDQYFVAAIIHNSPADLAGIQPGDTIIKMGRRKSKSLTLERITKKLSRKEGKKIKLVIRRGDETFKKSFRLKEFYQDKSKIDKL